MTEPAQFLDAETKRIRQLVSKYCSTQRHPSLPAFVVHGPLTQDELWKSHASSKPGCYVIYGEGGGLRYIGMSVTNIGNRLGSHLSAPAQQSPFWKTGSPPRYFDIIEVTQPWEAPSLEAYLIDKTAAGTSQAERWLGVP